MIGLLVTQAGFPPAYDVFAGNTFEGKTILPVVEDFTAKHPDTKPIIVADAAMLDDDRLAELREKGILCILSNSSLGTIKQVYGALSEVNGTMTRLHFRLGDLICDFSAARYKKELNELN